MDPTDDDLLRGAMLCGPSRPDDPDASELVAIPADEVSMDDRQTVADFAHLLAGRPGCLICMTPDSECPNATARAVTAEGCCTTCREGRTVHATLGTRPDGRRSVRMTPPTRRGDTDEPPTT